MKNLDKKWLFKEYFVVFRKFVIEYIVFIFYIMSIIFCLKFRVREVFVFLVNVCLFLLDSMNYLVYVFFLVLVFVNYKLN